MKSGSWEDDWLPVMDQARAREESRTAIPTLQLPDEINAAVDGGV